MATQHNFYTINNEKEAKLLRAEAKRLAFPLSQEDLADIKILEDRYDSEENCAGLAAPQIGISKAFMFFGTPYEEAFRKWRPDWTDSMPKTLWINPTYEGIEDSGKHVDYESCISVPDMAGLVKRYKKINYTAFDIEGNLISGSCEGFLARIIQHETDHLNGIIYADVAEEGSVMSVDAYRKMRAEALAKGESE